MYHILLAEDDRDLAEVIRMYLSKEEIHTLVAGDGEEAWQIFRSNHIDLALVDIMMPKMNGYELIRKIRESSKIPVAILSARNRVLDKVTGMETGADLYLTKPIDMKELSASVEALLRRCYRYSSEEEVTQLIRAGVLVLMAGGMILAILVRRFLQKELSPITEAVREYSRQGTYHSPEDLPEELVPIDGAMQSLQEGLLKAQKAKQEEERKRTLMLLGISHDLKNPLAVISGSVDTLQNKELSEAEKGHLMTLMKDNAQECAGLLDSFTYYSGMEQAAAHSRWEKADLCEFLRTYLAERYGDILAAGDFLEADIPEKEINRSISEGLFRRALGNLVNNSMKHNPPGITIYAGIEETEEEIILRIGDNGIGISPDIREHIFEPYVTTNTARTPGKGTGMGLAVAGEVVKAHGGELVLADSDHWSVIFEIRLKQQ